MIQNWWHQFIASMEWWDLFGYGGQACFSARWLWQMFVSHKAKQSVVPSVFWYISLAGAALYLIFGIAIAKGPIILAGVFGLVVYLHNISLLRKSRPREA